MIALDNLYSLESLERKGFKKKKEGALFFCFVQRKLNNLIRIENFIL